MNYYLYLFSPKTWKTFCEKGGKIAGVRNRQRNQLKNKLNKGDLLISYCGDFSRFIGILEFKGNIRKDEEPYFVNRNDPFIWRFDVEGKKFINFSEAEKSIPLKNMLEDSGAKQKFLDNTEYSGNRSEGQILSNTFSSLFGQSSLRKIDSDIAKKVVDIMLQNKDSFILNEKDQKELSIIEEIDRDFIEKDDEMEEVDECGFNDDEKKIHSKMQAKLAKLAEKWNYNVWIPRSDKDRVKKQEEIFNEDTFIDKLPTAYSEDVLKVIKNIDVIWINGNSMPCAFEVENTTTIYSGLLRLNDFAKLMPDNTMKFYIVSHSERYEKFNREINRPSFKDIYDRTSFLSYESLMKLFQKDVKVEMIRTDMLDEIADLPS